MVKTPPHGRVRNIRHQTGQVTAIEANESVAPVNLLCNVHSQPEFALVRMSPDAQRIQAVRAHSQHHHMLRDHVERHDERLSHQRGTATGQERFNRLSSPVLCAQVSHALVRVNVTRAGEDLHRGDPEASVKATDSFLSVDLPSCVDHSAVNVVLELDLEMEDIVDLRAELKYPLIPATAS